MMEKVVARSIHLHDVARESSDYGGIVSRITISSVAVTTNGIPFVPGRFSYDGPKGESPSIADSNNTVQAFPHCAMLRIRVELAC
jgi:hypothetical protein